MTEAFPPINIPPAKDQIAYAVELATYRVMYLQDVVMTTVEKIKARQLNRELDEYASEAGVEVLKKWGLRGEMVLATPCVLATNPRALAYYRMLLGFGRTTFYSDEFGLKDFRGMEVSGELSETNRIRLPALCQAVNASADTLLEGIGAARLSRELFDDLTLLTLGAMVRDERERDAATP